MGHVVVRTGLTGAELAACERGSKAVATQAQGIQRRKCRRDLARRVNVGGQMYRSQQDAAVLTLRIKLRMVRSRMKPAIRRLCIASQTMSEMMEIDKKPVNYRQHDELSSLARVV